MTDDLEILRPEVREAVREIVLVAAASRTDLQHSSATIRAELLRLARNDADARIALDADHDWKEMYERAKKAEAELAALKARTEWQPIETAPRDGTWIYVCRAGQPHSGTKVKFSRDCGGCPESWWDGSGFYRNPTFTHWMPLPQPPKGED